MLENKKKSNSSPQLSEGTDVSESESRANLDQELMAKVKRGDQKAFRLLYDHYKGPVMGYLNSLIGNQKAAEDLTQEAFLKVYRFKDQYEPQLKFTAWLWTIARNTALDQLRKKNEKLVSDWNNDDSESGSTEDKVGQIADESPNTEAILIENANHAQVKQCISGLTVAQRDALMLRTLSELSYEEIAAQLKLSLSSVKSLINRAKAALIRCIGGMESAHD